MARRKLSRVQVGRRLLPLIASGTVRVHARERDEQPFFLTHVMVRISGRGLVVVVRGRRPNVAGERATTEVDVADALFATTSTAVGRNPPRDRDKCALIGSSGDRVRCRIVENRTSACTCNSSRYCRRSRLADSGARGGADVKIRRRVHRRERNSTTLILPSPDRRRDDLAHPSQVWTG